MLGAQDWHTAPDETIESLGFLLLETEPSDDGGSQIMGWELGVGNATQLLWVESATADEVDGEPALLRALLHEQLDEHRHSEPPLTVVTGDRETLPLLRDRVLASDVDATFRGLRHLSLGALLAEHFDTVRPPALSAVSAAAPDVERDAADVERLRLAMNRILPLVSRQAATGDPL